MEKWKSKKKKKKLTSEFLVRLAFHSPFLILSASVGYRFCMNQRHPTTGSIHTTLVTKNAAQNVLSLNVFTAADTVGNHDGKALNSVSE